MDEEETKRPCPPYCDWPVVGHHVKEEMARVSSTLGAMNTQFQTWMQTSRGETDSKLRLMMEDVSRQLLTLTEACKVNLEMCNANRVDLGALKAVMLRNAAISSSIIAGVMSVVLIFVDKVVTKLF